MEEGFLYPHIQIKGNPGIDIYMDDVPQGKTTADLGGLIIQDVPTGEHTLKAVKEGFQPQTDTISVASGEVQLFVLRPFIPKLEIEERGEAEQNQMDLQVGCMLIQSIPVEMTIAVPKLGIESFNKTKDEWEVKKVPIGKHRAVFKAIGKEISYDIEVKENIMVHLMVNFLKGEVSVLSETTC